MEKSIVLKKYKDEGGGKCLIDWQLAKIAQKSKNHGRVSASSKRIAK